MEQKRGGPAKAARRLLRSLGDLIDPEGKKQRQESVKKLESMQRCVEKQKSVHSKFEQLRGKLLEKLKEKERAREEAKRRREEKLRKKIWRTVGFQGAKIAFGMFFPVVPLIPDLLLDLDLLALDLPALDLPALDLPDLDLPDISSFSLEDFCEIPDISDFLPDDIDFDDLLYGIGDVLDATDLEDMVDGLNLDFVNLDDLVAVEGQLDATSAWLDEMLASC